MEWKSFLVEKFKDRPKEVGYYPILFQDYILHVIGDKPLWDYEGHGHLKPAEDVDDA